MSVLGLRPAEVQVLLLIEEYLSVKGYKWFNYRGLRYYLQWKHPEVEWHTVERVIRRLAENGLLERKYYKRNNRQQVAFYPTQTYYETLRKLKQLVEEVKV